MINLNNIHLEPAIEQAAKIVASGNFVAKASAAAVLPQAVGPVIAIGGSVMRALKVIRSVVYRNTDLKIPNYQLIVN